MLGQTALALLGLGGLTGAKVFDKLLGPTLATAGQAIVPQALKNL